MTLSKEREREERDGSIVRENFARERKFDYCSMNKSKATKGSSVRVSVKKKKKRRKYILYKGVSREWTKDV